MKEIRMKAEISKKNDARSGKEAEILQTKDVKAEPQAADCSGRGCSQSASTVARGCTATVSATATVPASATSALTRRKYQPGTADPEYRSKLPTTLPWIQQEVRCFYWRFEVRISLFEILTVFLTLRRY